jgi:anaerobic selenocysteine-containing dehydrogenase
MNDAISRREFLKIAGLGSGIGAVLTGCGPASRYVKRQPYGEMPEYTVTGQSVYFATTCGECSASCGLIVRTMEGRAHKVEGNPAHPVAHGGTCTRGQATLQGLYNPDRIQEPGKQASRGAGKFDPIDWETAVGVVKDALQKNAPGEIAFMMGLFPDHLFDLVQMISTGLGGANITRFGTLGEYEARITLAQAAKNQFGIPKIPSFDLENAEMTFSFGANFVETWLSPVAYAKAYGVMRQGHQGQRGYLVQFESRMSQTAANADEWHPINPGSEALLAQGLARLVAELKTGSVPAAFAEVNISAVAAKSGISVMDLNRLAALYANSPRPIAIPGGIPLGNTNGLAAAESILALNLLTDNFGKPGSVFFIPDKPIYTDLSSGPSSIAEIKHLIDMMNSGQIKVLFVHGVNPIYDIPKTFGFAQALQKVPLVVSFGSFPDETTMQADYVLPDSTPLESWGYQNVVTASDRTAVSGLQPVVVPLYNTRATADVLLAAVQLIGGTLSNEVPYTDEVDFLQKSVAVLMDKDGFYDAPTPESFWVLWQQYGGWWKAQPDRITPQENPAFSLPTNASMAQFSGDPLEYPLYCLLFPSPNLGDGSVANRPMLQEAPDPMTTVMWNSWVEINPLTAQQLGIKSDDVVKITSPVSEVEAVVYEFPGINPGVIAIPLGQGHTAFGRYAQARGINPQDLLDALQNEAGNLAFMAVRVKITPTGQQYKLARYESRAGVYGTRSFFQGG